jgi:subtilisin family serine protease
MILRGRFRRSAALAIAALAAACALAPSAGAKSQPAAGDLSARLAELAKPAVRAAPLEKQAAILDVAPSGPGSLVREGNRVLVDVRFDQGAAAGIDALRDAGARIVNVSTRYQTVTVAVAPASLHEVAEVSRVDAVTENLTPILLGVDDPGPSASAIRLCFGAATSEGDTQLNAMRARDAFSLDGSGVTVGILSDTFAKDITAPTSAAVDVASGDLPGPGNPCEYLNAVSVLDDSEPSGSDEGRAMAQIVHDLAPAAQLSFATAFGSMSEFADNIRALAGAGADVIVDDVIHLDEPFFQEGPVGVAVSDVTDDGVAYFSAAGNNNLIGGGENFASWETPAFRDSGGCPAGLPVDVVQCLDFNPDTPVDRDFAITVGAGRTLRVDLQWNQPWFGVTTDLDAYLLDSSDSPIAESTDSNIDQKPFELIFWRNEGGSAATVRLAINRCFGNPCNPDADPGAKPRLKFILVQNGGGVSATEYMRSTSGDIVGPTIFGHNGAEDAMSVGAIRYSTMTAPEAFSSRGPVTHYFGPVVDDRPASALGSPKVLAKPDLVATNGGANTFFGSCLSDVWRFFGTSAAAPHAAAIAALEFQAAPASTPVDIKDAQIDNALSIPAFPATAVGTGIVDAFRTVESLVGAGTGSQTTQSTSPNCGQGPPPPPPNPPDPEPRAPITFNSPASSARDRVRPETLISQGPGKVSFTQGQWKRVVFRFRSSEEGSAFICKIDQGPFHQCHRKLVRWFEVGEHVLRVKARDAAGNVDRSPAVYRFQIKRAS